VYELLSEHWAILILSHPKLLYTDINQETTAMENRRKETRKKIMAFTLVRDEKGRLLGYLADLTHQGVMVIGEKHLDVDTKVTLAIDLPEELLLGLSRKLVLPAIVRRCAPDEAGSPDLNIGFEFTNITPEQTQLIEMLLDRYHFRHRSWESREEK
jgi:Tfp pilus assembly protein PilZ